jgi:hypothetical protein
LAATVTASSTHTGPIDRIGLFGYRTSVLESEVIKPLLLFLLDPNESAISSPQITKTLDAIESWMVRRMLVRQSTKAYNKIVPDLVNHLREEGRSSAGDLTEKFLAGQTSESSYWPDNDEIRKEIRELKAYRRIGRGRLRMVLESIEDHRRGWVNGVAGIGDERVARSKFAIEHVMPRKWNTYWPLPPGTTDADRESLIHTLGNLTLLTTKLNSKVSNGPWVGPDGKRDALNKHDALFMNRPFQGKAEWSEESIRSRTEEMAKMVTEIWQVPANHRSGYAYEKPKQGLKFSLSDLLNAGLLQPGMTLFPRRSKFANCSVTLLPDGSIDVNGVIYPSPSSAAAAVRGKPTSGWWFFLVNQIPKQSLRDVCRKYAGSTSDEVEDEEDEEEDDEE